MEVRFIEPARGIALNPSELLVYFFRNAPSSNIHNGSGLDTLQYTRELKRLGVGVLFMNDNINTLDPDAELRLTIMSSIAQEKAS